jgi:hypothetical protein
MPWPKKKSPLQPRGKRGLFLCVPDGIRTRGGEWPRRAPRRPTAAPAPPPGVGVGRLGLAAPGLEARSVRHVRREALVEERQQRLAVEQLAAPGLLSFNTTRRGGARALGPASPLPWAGPGAPQSLAPLLPRSRTPAPDACLHTSRKHSTPPATRRWKRGAGSGRVAAAAA